MKSINKTFQFTDIQAGPHLKDKNTGDDQMPQNNNTVFSTN